MGKSALIGVICFITIIANVMASLYVRSNKLPEILSEKVSENQANSISNYALKYAIKEVSEGNIIFSTTPHLETYNNFSVQDGFIDSLRYIYDSDHNTLQIVSYVHTIISDKKSSHSSEVFLDVYMDKFGYIDLPGAIMTAGTIKLKAKSVVNGKILQKQVFNFEDIFGVPAKTVKSAALENNSYYHYSTNHNPEADGITWADGNVKLNSHWQGSGILVVNGDLKIVSHVKFNGIIFVFGEFELGAQSRINGTIFILDTGRSDLKAHSSVTFDPDLSRKWFGHDLGGKNIKLKSWIE